MDWTKDLTEKIEAMPTRQKNIRTLTALENLIDNIENVPIEKIEKLTEDL